MRKTVGYNSFKSSPRKVRLSFYAALLCGAAAGSSGCVFMPREAGEKLQADMLALRGDVQRLRASYERSEAHKQEHDQQFDAQVQGLQKRMDAAHQSTHLAEADMGTQLDRLVQELQQLRGLVEDNAHQLGETEGKLEQKLSERMAALQKADDARSKAAARAARPSGKKELLAFARRALRNGRGEEGREILRDLTGRFGKERGIGDEALLTLAGDAQAQGRFDNALRDYVRLLDTFPSGRHSDEAYFRVGECSEALDRLGYAKTFYNEVIAGYPRSSWAKKARQRLAALTANANKRGSDAAGGSDGKDGKTTSSQSKASAGPQAPAADSNGKSSAAAASDVAPKPSNAAESGGSGTNGTQAPSQGPAAKDGADAASSAAAPTQQ